MTCDASSPKLRPLTVTTSPGAACDGRTESTMGTANAYLYESTLDWLKMRRSTSNPRPDPLGSSHVSSVLLLVTDAPAHSSGKLPGRTMMTELTRLGPTGPKLRPVIVTAPPCVGTGVAATITGAL